MAVSRTPVARQASGPRFLSRDAYQALASKVFGMSQPDGWTILQSQSEWMGNIRWARNEVTTGGDTRNIDLTITRYVHGATGQTMTNVIDDETLLSRVRRAEELLRLQEERPDDYPQPPYKNHPHAEPKIWFDSTYDLDENRRGQIAERLIQPAMTNKVLSAGYLRVAGIGVSVLNNKGLFRYYPYTTAEYSVTVRDPAARASGWAGVDWNDWTRIDTDTLSQIALDKCLRSRNPAAVEPGRYTAILEPQAVCQLASSIVDELDRVAAESGYGPFAGTRGNSRIGQRVLDERLTLSADPMDPDCGFVPFDRNGEPYRKVNWIEDGVLKALSYDRTYGLRELGIDAGLPNSKAFRLSGGTATIDDMIAQTKRGIYVTRFNNFEVIHKDSLLAIGNTRDGLWLIENGKISRAIKNFRITESALFVLNNVEMMGVPQRTFRPSAPAVVPPLLVRDFSFTGMMDGV